MSKVQLIALSLLTLACTNDKKLDQVLTRLDALDKKIDAMPGALAAGQRPQPRRGLDPATVYAVSVDDADPFIGPKHAKVTIVEAYEYACPYCRMAAEVIDKVVEARPDVKVVGKQYVVHPEVATQASLAACAAAKQSKYGPFSKALWASAWSSEGRLDRQKLTPESLVETAEKTGLDVTRLKNDMGGCQKEIEQDQRELSMLGVNGTPSFFINGKPYMGPRTVEGFTQVIDDEVKKADEALKNGAKIEEYYASLVRNGKKTL